MTGQDQCNELAVTTVYGPVVQARTITGGIHHHAAPHEVPVPRQLPPAPSLFVGRATELDRLTQAMDKRARGDGAVAISALAGAGGVGKTWLALHWAHAHGDRFPDGQLFVDLQGFSPAGVPMDPAVAVRGFLDAFGIDPARIPPDPHAQAALYRSLVAGRRMLIVLDNAADAGQVVPLLPGSSTCTVVVTSRRHLTSLITRHGACHLPVRVLEDADAHQLLTTRLGADRIAAEPDAVRELLSRCSGYPMALGIVAGRAHITPDAPLAELAADLRDDEDPAASLPTVLSWSLRALTGEQAHVFKLLGIAPGPDIGMAAAAALTELDVAQVRKVLSALAQASLLGRDSHNRYSMHDLIRGDAADRAHHDIPPADRAAALRRVVRFYLQTAHTADRLLAPDRPPIELTPAEARHSLLPDLAAALRWFETEHLCLLAAQHTAVTHGWHQTAWQLAWAMDTFHYRRGHLYDRLAVWHVGLAATEHVQDLAAKTIAHRLLGYACGDLGRHDEAVDHLHQALSLTEHTNDHIAQAFAHRALASAWERTGDHRRALEHATHALHLHRASGDSMWEGVALSGVAWHSAMAGEFEQAREHCHTALALHRNQNQRGLEADALDCLGLIDHNTGHHAEALDHYRQAVALRRDLGHTFGLASTLDRLGHTHIALGQHEQARTILRESLELYQAQGRDTEAAHVQLLLDGVENP